MEKSATETYQLLQQAYGEDAMGRTQVFDWFSRFNPLALELDIYSLAHHLYEMWIFYEPRRVTLGNTRHFVEE